MHGIDSMNIAEPEITKLLQAWNGGDSAALKTLMPAVYEELRSLAEQRLRGRQYIEAQPTSLVNDVYLRLRGAAAISWQDRAHFFAVAAQMMRRILVDYARARSAAKRGDGAVAITLDESLENLNEEKKFSPDVLDIHRALQELEQLNSQHARIVELRFFSGLSIEETAEVMHISPAKVKRNWVIAKTWVRQRLREVR